MAILCKTPPANCLPFPPVIIYLFAFILHLIACKLLCIGQHMAPNVRTSSRTSPHFSLNFDLHPGNNLLTHSIRTFRSIPCGVANQTHTTHTHSKITIRRICTHFRDAMPIGAPSPPEKVTTFPVSISRRVPSGLHFSKCPQCPGLRLLLHFRHLLLLRSRLNHHLHPWPSHPFFGPQTQCATCRSC